MSMLRKSYKTLLRRSALACLLFIFPANAAERADVRTARSITAEAAITFELHERAAVSENYTAGVKMTARSELESLQKKYEAREPAFAALLKKALAALDANNPGSLRGASEQFGGLDAAAD
jgi:hypothetical protein